jgi:DNA-binding IclR family transcriptional regulator
MSAESTLVRQWRLLRTLESRPRSVRELSCAIGISKADVRRDLVTLERAGFPVFDYKDDDGHRWWSCLRRAPARIESDGAR